MLCTLEPGGGSGGGGYKYTYFTTKKVYFKQATTTTANYLHLENYHQQQADIMSLFCGTFIMKI